MRNVHRGGLTLNLNLKNSFLENFMEHDLFWLLLVWPVLLAQVWTHYKIGELMWTLFCNVCIDFLNSQIWNEIMLELNDKSSSVTTFSTDFSLQNLGFLEFIWIFSCRNHLKINISHILNPNIYQINSIKSCSSRSFQQHQRYIPIPLTFSATIEFNFLWRNHSIFKNFCTTSPNVMEPSPCTPPHW